VLIREAAASALNALDARALVNGVRLLEQTCDMSRPFFWIREDFRDAISEQPMKLLARNQRSLGLLRQSKRE
jgi:hypothetical protein